MAATKISCNLTEDEFKKLQAILGRSRMARLLGVTIARVQQFKRKYGMTDPTNFKGRFKPAFDVPKEQLAEMYLGEKMSVHEIAKSLGWSDWTIVKALRKDGIYMGRGGNVKPVPVEMVQSPVVEVVEKPPEPEKPVEAPSEAVPEIPDEEYDVPVNEPVIETVLPEWTKLEPPPPDDKIKIIAEAVNKELEEKGIYKQMDKLTNEKCPTCEGTGKSYSHSHELDCPTCKGTGNKPKEANLDKAVKESIERIKTMTVTKTEKELVPGPVKKTPTKEEMEDMYLRRGMSIRVIARETGRRVNTIFNLIKKYGIKTRGHGPVPKVMKPHEESAENENDSISKPEGDKDGPKSDTGKPEPPK